MSRGGYQNCRALKAVGIQRETGGNVRLIQRLTAPLLAFCLLKREIKEKGPGEPCKGEMGSEFYTATICRNNGVLLLLRAPNILLLLSL
ncbi:hypothetical protein ACFX13_002697 [Malus domestica]